MSTTYVDGFSPQEHEKRCPNSMAEWKCKLIQWKKHKKRKKSSFPQQNWTKLSESLSFDVYNMQAKAGKWVFRAPRWSLKRGVAWSSRRQIVIGIYFWFVKTYWDGNAVYLFGKFWSCRMLKWHLLPKA